MAMHCALMLKFQGVHEWNHTSSFPESSVDIAYFLNLVWLLIDCNLMSHCVSFKDNVLSDNQYAGKQNPGDPLEVF